VRREHRVRQAVDPGLALLLVPDAEAQVHHQRHPPLRGEADGVVHRTEHGAGGRDAALRAERDLEAEKLRARRHPVEALHAVEVVRPGDARHVGAVGVEIEYQVEGGRGGRAAEVDGDSEARRMAARSPAEALPGLQVVVYRTLAGQRAVAVGIGQQYPAVGGAGHHDRERVPDGLVAVEVRRGRAVERQLGHDAAEPGTVAGHRAGASESHQPLPRHLHGVAVRADRGEGDAALAGKVAQVEQLGLTGAGGLETGDGGIDSRVEDGDQDTAPVEGRMRLAEPIHPGAPERHPVVREGGLGRGDALHPGFGWRFASRHLDAGVLGPARVDVPGRRRGGRRRRRGGRLLAMGGAAEGQDQGGADPSLRPG
jgi:hypothetical protein